MTDKIKTPEFRVGFPHVFEPQAPMEEGQKPKYGVTMLFPKGTDLTSIKNLLKEAAREKWGDNTPSGLHNPLRDQGEKDLDGYEAGAIFCAATSKQRPGLVDHNVQPIMDQTDFYAGCYAIASVRAFAYEVRNKQGVVVKRGVGLGLQNLMKTREGEPFGGRSKPEDDFEPINKPNDGGSDFDPAGPDVGDGGDASNLFD